MKYSILFLIGAACFSFPLQARVEPSQEEVLLVRRIALLEQNHDKEAVLSQIQQFQQKFPKSSFLSALKIMAGDLEFESKNYREALVYYDQVKDPQLRKANFDKRISSLHHEKKHRELFEELRPLFSYESQNPNEDTEEQKKYRNYYMEAVSALHLTDSELKGDQKNEALKRAALLYNLKAHQQLIVAEEELLLTASEKDHAEILFMIGKSYFILEEYEKATARLSPLLSDNSLKGQRKGLLLTLIAAAYHLKQAENVHQWLIELEKEFPKDPAIAKGLYFEALAYQKSDIEHSQKSLQRILNEFPEFDQLDSVQFELNRILGEQGKWKESRLAFLGFIQQYPDSPLRNQVFNMICSASLNALEKAKLNQEPVEQLSEQLTDDLTYLLDKVLAPDASTRADYELILAKTCCSLKRYNNATAILTDFIKHHPSNPQLFQAHLLLALCYYEGQQDHNGFIRETETALSLNPTLPNNGQVHLNLFSLYLERANENKETLSGPNLEKAAEHLFVALSKSESEIHPSNLLWAANYYYDRTKTQSNPANSTENQDASRAILAFEKALEVSQHSPHLKDLKWEGELYKMTTLLAKTGQRDYQLVLLEDLTQQQANHSKRNSPYQSQALFALGEAYSVMGDTHQAIATYTLLTSQKKATDPYLEAASALRLARLLFETLPPQGRMKENGEVVKVLKLLKELQMRKSLAQEPMHLEAAIDYANFSATLETPELQDKRLLEAYYLMKEDFTQKQDIWSKDYHASRERMPEQNNIYEAYMMLLDAHIATLEAAKSFKGKNIYDAESKKEAARSLYLFLLKSKFTVSKYLTDQAESGLKRVNSLK